MEHVALVGVAVSVALVALKVALAYASRSLVVTATAVDSAVDVVGAVVLWIGLRLATRKTTRFPYGLYKIENVLQVVVAVLVFVGAYEIGVKALQTRAQTPTIRWWVLLGMVAAIGLTLAYSIYATRQGRRLSSPALAADGRHRLVDVMSATLALIAVASTYGGLEIDRYAALPILAIVVYSGWGLLRDGMKVLLDASVDRSTLSLIESILLADPLVVSVRALTARSAGRYVFAEATVAVRTDSLTRGHAATERLERALSDGVPAVEHVTLHLEPQEKEHIRLGLPLQDEAGRLSEEFGSAPYFAIVDMRIADGETVSRDIRANPHSGAERQKGLLVAEWLVGMDVDLLLHTGEVKKGPAYGFGNSEVRTRHITARQLDEALLQFAGEVRGARQSPAPG